MLRIHENQENQTSDVDQTNVKRVMKEMKEKQELEIKETNNTIWQKMDLAYSLWILDYPKKKEKDMVEEVVNKVNKIKRSGVVEKLSIEEQKVILMAPTII